MQSAKIISNSSPLINLSKIEKLDLIEKLYTKVLIPQAVFEELVLKRKEKSDTKGIMELIDRNIIEIREVKNINFVVLLRKYLDKGESEVIALALEEKSPLIIVDEIEARRVAETSYTL